MIMATSVRFAVDGRFDLTGRGTVITGTFVDESGQPLRDESAVLRIDDRLVDQTTGSMITIRGIPFVCRPGRPPTEPPPSLSLAITEERVGTVTAGTILVAKDSGLSGPARS